MEDLANLIGHLMTNETLEKRNILDLGSSKIDTKIKLLLTKFKNSFRYTAVDTKTPHWIFSREVDEEVQSLEHVTTTDWVEKINHQCQYEIDFKAISEEDFNEMFNLKFSKDALEYCRESVTSEKYDIIVISQLLHFLDQKIAEELVRLCISMLRKDGIIYIGVLHSEQTQYPRKNLYSKTDFDALNMGLQIIEQKSNLLYHELLGRKK